MRRALACLAFAACGGSTSSPADAPVATPDAAPDASPTAICAQLGLPVAPWVERETGPLRGMLAGDFDVPLADGTRLSLRQAWTGCEVWAFLPDSVPVSGADTTSVWTQDLPALLATSPRNAHYVFAPVGADDAAAQASAMAMQTRVDAALAAMSADDRAHWQPRVHVIATRAGALVNWLTLTLSAAGRTGFVVDRDQRIRGVGSLADVSRYDQALANANQWPWRNNLAYLANEVVYANARAAEQARIAATQPTTIDLWSHELVSGNATKDVTLPAMTGFDHAELEVELTCPSDKAIELGNCGAWDYIANLVLVGATDVELARFITPYHREARWTVDITPLLPLLTEGAHTLRWTDAPDWNLQPTYVTIKLHLSHHGGPRPTQLVPLWTGGALDPAYAAAHAPVDVAIPATATKVELVAIVTGHGDQNGCAEFCDHHHAFTVGGAAPHVIAFPEAGTDAGCVATIDDGTTPNQAGTWWFGRGGWCPGQQVTPHVFDITSEVTKGATASIGYAATVGTTTPTVPSGEIVLSSWIAIYE